MAAGNAMFLDLTGPSGPVSGSSTDAQFDGKIELQKFTFAVSPVPRKRAGASTLNSPTALTAPKPTLGKNKADKDDDGDDKKTERRKDDSITVIKVVDSASAELLMYYCRHLEPDVTGQEFKKAVITFRVARGASGLALLVLTFTGLYLIDYKLDQITKDTTHPTETLSFSYKTCTIQYSAEPLSSTAAPSPRSVTWTKPTRQTS